MSNEEQNIMTDEEATEAHWFLLECFTRELFGRSLEVEMPIEEIKTA